MSAQIHSLSNYTILDSVNVIVGMIDNLILQDGKPLEIKEYKTGKDYTRLQVGTRPMDERLTILEEHRLQVMIYGWLVLQKFGSLPRWITIYYGYGKPLQIDFSHTEIITIKNELIELGKKN